MAEWEIYHLDQAETDGMNAVMTSKDIAIKPFRFMVSFDAEGNETIWMAEGVAAGEFLVPTKMPGDINLINEDTMSMNTYQFGSAGPTFALWHGGTPKRWWYSIAAMHSAKIDMLTKVPAAAVKPADV